MEIKHIALHQIIRFENEIPKLNCSNHLLDSENPVVVDFIESLVKSFGRKGPTYGRFEDDEVNYPFQKHVKEYRKNHEFLNFSVNAMKIIKAKIQVPKATGGYVIFAHYIEKQIDFMVTAMLNKSAQFAVDDESLDINKLETLAIDKLARANRLNISKWEQNTDETYLAFIKGTREVSDYFQRFIGNTDLTSSKVNSSNLNTAMNRFMRQENYTEEEKANKRQKIFNYIEDRRKKNEDVHVNTVSALLCAEQPDKFTTYIEKNEDLEVSNVFRVVKKADTYYFHKTKIAESGYTLEFEKSLKKEKKIIRQGNDIVIKNVPQEILNEEFGEVTNK